MMNGTKLSNRGIFLVSVILTGAIAGAFIWLLLFLMNLGLGFIWSRLPDYFGKYYPIWMCLLGGLVIGLFAKKFGPLPDELPQVMAKVKQDGRYEYDNLGPLSVAALLPMIFGGSIGPEAGLTGAIAGVCTWVGDRMKRFGKQFRELTSVGTMAALSAIFTAPLFGVAGAMYGAKPNEDKAVKEEPVVTKWMKLVINVAAIIGAVGTFLLLSVNIGGGLSLPHYSGLVIGADELIWMIPIILVGAAAGWIYDVCDVYFCKYSEKHNDKPVLKAVIAGLLLGLIGFYLPFTMFAGEMQAEELGGMWLEMSVAVLLATGFVKVVVTSMCINFGWRGGQFFPLIFSGISIGYGMSLATGIDPVFCLCVVTAALMGTALRMPVMVTLLLFLCFPVQGVLLMIVAAFIGSKMPLPRYVRENMKGMAAAKNKKKDTEPSA